MGLITDIGTSYGEFMTLFSKTVAERTRPGQRQDVEEQGTGLLMSKNHFSNKNIDYTFHAYGRTEGIAGIIIPSTPIQSRR
jgi:synaptobrevin family protein YKT6